MVESLYMRYLCLRILVHARVGDRASGCFVQPLREVAGMASERLLRAVMRSGVYAQVIRPSQDGAKATHSEWLSQSLSDGERE